MSSNISFELKKSELKPEENEVKKSKTFMVKNKEAFIHLENLEDRNRIHDLFGKPAEIQNLINESVRTSTERTTLSSEFNSYSTKKNFATGLLDLALIATNFSQMKQLIVTRRSSQWHTIDIVLMFSICASLILQFVCGIVLVFSTKQEDFCNEEKRIQSVKNNNSITLIVLVITIVNIFINVFINI